ncbi:ABC transporter permease [Acinetobacter sp. NCu2D-2]|uniref:MFS transporter n=1 Tax=Acinetobacter sp. NCu2D-2 TaxID=1608473 RepID=UPI0007CDE4D8|nr:MFS transporter [Acinetobacter sp. NCu2D-2]ANF81768.1 ABC transporter permease [Acinetobacter sp. NCu2D-2]
MSTQTLFLKVRQFPLSVWQKIATALCFFSLGFSTAAWAPMIANVTHHLQLSHSQFGILLLGAGIGSMIAMPIAAKLANQFGCRPILAVLLFCFMGILPALAMSSSVWMLAIALFGFGFSAGGLGVTVNLQATQIEKITQQNLMPLFHGICSLGGLIGVSLVTFLMSIGFSIHFSALTISFILLLIVFAALPFCLGHQKVVKENTSDQVIEKKALPSVTILFIGLICFVSFLSEGAAMDWSGIYLNTHFKVDASQAGLAYSFFAALMMTGRFAGQFIIHHLGERNTILMSAVLASLGLMIVVFAPIWQIVLMGYAVLGLGSSNIVPLMFSKAGRQTQMPSHTALSYVSLFAYSGSLMGPAFVGFASDIFGLAAVFTIIAFALLAIALMNQMTNDHATVIDIETHHQTPA